MEEQMNAILTKHPDLNHYGFLKSHERHPQNFCPKRIAFIMEILPFLVQPCQSLRRDGNHSKTIREMFRNTVTDTILPNITTGEVTLAMMCLDYKPHMIKSSPMCKFRIEPKIKGYAYAHPMWCLTYDQNLNMLRKFLAQHADKHFPSTGLEV